MSRFVNQILIQKPIEVVFNYATTPAYWPIYHPMSKKIEPLIKKPYEVTDPPFIETVETLGIEQDIKWSLVSRTFPSNFYLSGEIKDMGGGSSNLLYIFQEVEVQGSKMTLFVRIFENTEHSIFMKFASKLIIDDMIKQEGIDALQKLKEILESMP